MAQNLKIEITTRFTWPQIPGFVMDEGTHPRSLTKAEKWLWRAKRQIFELQELAAEAANTFFENDQAERAGRIIGAWFHVGGLLFDPWQNLAGDPVEYRRVKLITCDLSRYIRQEWAAAEVYRAKALRKQNQDLLAEMDQVFKGPGGYLTPGSVDWAALNQLTQDANAFHIDPVYLAKLRETKLREIQVDLSKFQARVDGPWINTTGVETKDEKNG